MGILNHSSRIAPPPAAVPTATNTPATWEPVDLTAMTSSSVASGETASITGSVGAHTVSTDNGGSVAQEGTDTSGWWRLLTDLIPDLDVTKQAQIFLRLKATMPTDPSSGEQGIVVGVTKTAALADDGFAGFFGWKSGASADRIGIIRVGVDGIPSFTNAIDDPTGIVVRIDLFDGSGGADCKGKITVFQLEGDGILAENSYSTGTVSLSASPYLFVGLVDDTGRAFSFTNVSLELMVIHLNE